jgi:hypothetical protein
MLGKRMNRLEKVQVDPAGAAAGGTGRFVRHGALLRRVLNPVMVLLGQNTLHVRGRRTGRLLKIPMDPPFGWEGRRYLVSPMGETHWARNLRAAGEGELRVRRRSERFRTVELHGAEHDAIVDAYARTITCGCRRYMEMLPNPADHPAFRIEPAAGAG